MNIAFIPIDNRPVCYTLPEQIAKIDNNIKFFIPERKLLGGLQKTSSGIIEWLETLAQVDAVVISLDTIAYGGLIPSRRSSDTFDEIKNKTEILKTTLNGKKVYAFSSIMRISNNNFNIEEKEYWDKWGKKIFNYSYCMDKFGTMCKKEVPDEILEDYLNTRKRNFEINKLYLTWENFFETLVFSKDDCAEYGFNVQEAKMLETLGGFIKTGADEIPLTLFARTIKGKLKIAPIFLEPEYKNIISNYEDVSIEKSTAGQIELAGCEVSKPEEADILLYINNFKNQQGEIVMKVDTEPFFGKWQNPDKPYMIADVRFANGSDNAFVEQLFKNGFDENFYGYSAWNTSANTLGSLICAAKIKYFAKKSNSYNDEEFKKLQIIRFLDDWAYQANIRQKLENPNVTEIKNFMKPFEKKLFEIFKTEYNVNYKFPWNRLFEVEIELN